MRIGTVFVFTALMAAAVVIESVYLPTMSFIGLMLAIGVMNLTWLPRILARRSEELDADGQTILFCAIRYKNC